MHGLDPITLRKIIKEATDADFEETSTADKIRNAGYDIPLTKDSLMKMQFEAPELFKEFEETYREVHQHHARNAERFVILTEWDPVTSENFREQLTKNVN